MILNEFTQDERKSAFLKRSSDYSLYPRGEAMNIEQKGLLILIKSALTGMKLQMPDGFDFAKACEVAKQHGISAMIYYGALNCGVDTKCEQMQKLFTITCTYIAVSQRQLYKIEDICNAFEKNAIEYMLLKGSVLKKLYPKPEMRIMGDTDILIRTEQYGKIREIMMSLGFSEGNVSDHEFKWHHESLFVELHSKLIPSSNKDFYEYFGDGWNLAREKDGNDYRFKMTTEDELIYIFTHFAKHYRDAGIGLKHALDVWMYLKKNKELDKEYIKTELKKLNLYEFFVNVLETFEVWFEGRTATSKNELITDVIFKSGAAGCYEASVFSTMIKKYKSTSFDNIGIRKICNRIFEPFDVMCDKYKVLKKCPILLPAFWVANLADALRGKKFSRVMGNIKIINKSNVGKYQDDLKLVGLDFNFED